MAIAGLTKAGLWASVGSGGLPAPITGAAVEHMVCIFLGQEEDPNVTGQWSRARACHMHGWPGGGASPAHYTISRGSNWKFGGLLERGPVEGRGPEGGGEPTKPRAPCSWPPPALGDPRVVKGANKRPTPCLLEADRGLVAGFKQ